MIPVKDQNTPPKDKSNSLPEPKSIIYISAILILAVILVFPSSGVLFGFILAVIFLFLQRKRTQVFRSIGFRKPKNWWKSVIVCLILGIVIEMGFEILITPLVEYLTRSQIDLSAFYDVRGNLQLYLMWLAIGWIVGGFLEEITFRGYLITRLVEVIGENRISLFSILMITSIPFGLAHLYQGWSGVISTGLTALLLGLIFIKSNYNLWYPILTHGFINTVGFTVFYLDFYDSIRNIW